MLIAGTLVPGRLVRRYKRFLAEVRLDDGRLVTAHTANTGSMRQCAVPGRRVLVSPAAGPARKLAWNLELVRVNRRWVDIHTHRANRVVEEGLRQGRIPGLEGFEIRPEAAFGRSRFDFLLTRDGRQVFLEVKNVTLLCGEAACFPDAVTERGRRHLEELVRARRSGYRSVILFLVQRREASCFRPADGIDPAYGRTLRRAAARGVEVRAHLSLVRRPNVRLGPPLPVRL